MGTHYKKIWPEFFTDVKTGKKPFEIRKKDCDYKVGDQLYLREYDPKKRNYTGRYTLKVITYVLLDGKFGIYPGYCILGIKTPSVKVRIIQVVFDFIFKLIGE